jgi:nucleoid-associated protein YgaU
VEYQAQDDLVATLEQYKLALTVDPENELARDKSTSIQQELRGRAEEHYQTGLAFHRKGQYASARKELLTALRYDPEHIEAKQLLTATSEEIEQVKRYIPHTLQPGESISTLAEQYYGDYRKFHLIAEYNALEDATKVTVGQEIRIPVIEGTPIVADRAAIRTDTGEAPETMPGEIITVKRYVNHTIQPGDSLSKLAQTYYGDYRKFDLIAKFNGFEDPTSVQFGQQIKIPEVEGVPFLVEGEVEATEAAKQTEAPPERPSEEKEEGLIREQPTIEDQTTNYRELGIELFENKKYAAAITEFHKVLNVRPEDSVTREYLAKSHFQQGLVFFTKADYLRARDEFRAALEYDKDCDECDKNIEECEGKYKDIHYNKGLSYFKDQELADAIREWELVYALDPEYKDVDKNLTKAKNLLERLENIKRSKTEGVE